MQYKTLRTFDLLMKIYHHYSKFYENILIVTFLKYVYLNKTNKLMSKRVRLHENILTGLELEVLLITVPHENIS